MLQKELRTELVTRKYCPQWRRDRDNGQDPIEEIDHLLEALSIKGGRENTDASRA